MKHSGKANKWNITIEYFLLVSVAFFISYAFLFALLAPAGGVDEHAYHLPRLLFMEQEGLFSNTKFFDPRLECFPLVFDATFYPAVKLGFGYAIPNFLCFIGLLIIVYRISKKYFRGTHPLWYCLVLCTLPQVYMQSMSGKNHLPILFGLGCAIFYLDAWRSNRNEWNLVISILALAFAFGTKSNAVLYAFPIWIIGFYLANRWALRLRYTLYSIIIFTFFSGIEIYINNYITYGNFAGPEWWVVMHSNTDGIAGGIANMIRYFLSMLNPGIPIWGDNNSIWDSKLTDWTNKILNFFRISDFGHGMHFTKESFIIHCSNRLATISYGSLGLISILFSPFILVSAWKNDKVIKYLIFSAYYSIVITSYCIGWSPWKLRFYDLATILMVFAFVRFFLMHTKNMRWAQWILAVSSAFIGIAFLFVSIERKPIDLYHSVIFRKGIETRQRLGIYETYDILETISNRNVDKPTTVYIFPKTHAWLYSFLKMRDLDCRIVTKDSSLQSNWSDFPGDKYFLFIIHDVVLPEGFHFEMLYSNLKEQVYLYRLIE
jgi:hypothetical protein